MIKIGTFQIQTTATNLLTLSSNLSAWLPDMNNIDHLLFASRCYFFAIGTEETMLGEPDTNSLSEILKICLRYSANCYSI